MKIYINDIATEVQAEKPLIESLRTLGYHVPSMCYDANAQHEASCMVCMVKDVTRNQMIPSCSTYPTEGMHIETDTDEVLGLRRMSLELLLSDHRADCEAPCTQVCKLGLDPARILLYYDRGQLAEARALLMRQGENIPCADCKTPCEKACRRRTVDSNVSIRDIFLSLAKDNSINIDMAQQTDSASASLTQNTNSISVSNSFCSKLGRYTAEEKEWLKQTYDTPSRCLHCACEGSSKCKLRQYASEAGIKTIPYGVASELPVKQQIHVTGRLYFEPAKCIRCGLCVYNTKDGFTFLSRGFKMQITIPDESKAHVSESICSLCPTGALFLTDK